MRLLYGFAFGIATTLILLAAGPWLIDLMTASPDVRLAARDYLIYAALASVIGVFAFAYDGIYIGATWTRDMRNLMIAALALYLADMVADFAARQYRALDRDPGVLRLARRAAGRALSGARARDVHARPFLRGDGGGIAPDRIGQASSSRPTRRKSSRSFLIDATSPTPRKISPL